jgi:hypothetical protein
MRYLHPVRRLLFLVLSVQLLSSGQFLGEAVKVLNLLDHYRMHRGRGEVSDLAGFIHMHYFDPEHRRSDPDRHERLPLQHPSPNPLPACQPVVAAPALGGPCPSLPPSQVPQEQHRRAVSASFDIFQPPRTVC